MVARVGRASFAAPRPEGAAMLCTRAMGVFHDEHALVADLAPLLCCIVHYRSTLVQARYRPAWAYLHSSNHLLTFPERCSSTLVQSEWSSRWVVVVLCSAGQIITTGIPVSLLRLLLPSIPLTLPTPSPPQQRQTHTRAPPAAVHTPDPVWWVGSVCSSW